MILSFNGYIVLINGAMDTGGRGLRRRRTCKTSRQRRGSWIDSCREILLGFVIVPRHFNFHPTFFTFSFTF